MSKKDTTFNVVRLDSEKSLVRDDAGLPIVWETGSEAQEYASRLTDETGVKHQPRPILAKDWRKRERKRFADGTYIPVTWAEEPWFMDAKQCKDHFVHVAQGDPGKVAFTEDKTKGARDIQTRMRATRYLTRFFLDQFRSEYTPYLRKNDIEIEAHRMAERRYGGYSRWYEFTDRAKHKLIGNSVRNRIRDIGATFSALYENNLLQFTETEEDIIDVYENGPGSCMGGDEGDEFVKLSPVNPVSVYAGGDLQVAYLTRDGQITARALVWPEKKTHSRIYGDEARLGRLLKDAGYRFAAPWGARIKKIPVKLDDTQRQTDPHVRRAFHEAFQVPHEDGWWPEFFVMPYIDQGFTSGQGSVEAVDKGDHFVLAQNGNVPCSFTYGVSFIRPKEPMEECENCGEEIPRRTRHQVCVGTDEDDPDEPGERQWQHWCSDCLSAYAFECPFDGTAYHHDCGVVIALGTRYEQIASRWAVEERCCKCPLTGLLVRTDQTISVITKTGTQRWWRYAPNVNRKYVGCCFSGTRLAIDLAVKIELPREAGGPALNYIHPEYVNQFLSSRRPAGWRLADPPTPATEPAPYLDEVPTEPLF